MPTIKHEPGATGPGEAASRRAARGIVGAFAFLTIYFTGVFPPRSNPNELARFETVVAMGEWRTVSIDRAIALLGDHEDKSASGGRFYSNKAPGLSFAAYPIYLALRLVVALPATATGPVFYAIRLLTVSLASVIALCLLAVRIADDAKENSAAPLVVLAVGFGTPLLFYARSFFSHAWAASLLFFAWELLRRGGKVGARMSSWTAVLAGFLAGLATISEYTVAPIALCLALRAGVGAPRRRALEFALGAIAPLALLLVHNGAAFGSPFVLSYSREATHAVAVVASRGFIGFRFPSLTIALGYLFHPARGILVFSPFLAWSVLGIVRWWRSRENRPDCILVLAAIPLFFLLLCMYPDWHGGGSLGSRYLLPGLFLVAVPIGRSLRSRLSRGLFLAVTTFSVAQHFLLTASYPHLGLNIRWPAATASAWFLRHGFAAPNIGSLLGARPMASLLLPLAATLTALLLAARVGRPMQPGVSVALALGIAPLAALTLFPPAVAFEARLARADILGSFSDRDPEGREIRAVMGEATTAEERLRAEARLRHLATLPARTP